MEFKKVKLKDIGRIVTGCTPKTKNKEYYSKKDYLFIGPTDIKSCKYVRNSEKYISEKAYDDYSARFIEKNSIMIDCIGSDMGNVALSIDRMLTNQQINSITEIDEDKFNVEYIYYKLSTMKNYFHQIGTNGSTMPIINKTMFEEIEIEIPDKEIQDKVVKVLVAIDRKIELNNEINNNLLELGKTYFNEWISDCDEELHISDIAEEILDYTKNKKDFVKLLNSSDVTNNLFPVLEFVENKDLKGHFKKNFSKYDILYSQIRPRNHHYGYVLNDDTDDYIASTRLMVIRNKKKMVSSSLLYFYITSEEAIKDFTSKTESRSGTFPQGNYQDLSSFKIKYSHNQKEITEVLDTLLEKIYNNNIESQTLSELRDTLLPNLMNGEIDLENTEI